jgi:DNA-binding beta-propeller fold protein YncE
LGAAAVETASSPDGHYAFVSIEGAGMVAVYNLRASLADHFRRSSYVGSIKVGLGAVGLAVSSGGRLLYATSEVGRGKRGAEGDSETLAEGDSETLAGGDSRTPAEGDSGTLAVINLPEAERDPGRATIATVPAGCAPVRVAVSADGSTVWVTARGSDELLAFSAAKLQSDPAHALLSAVRVGDAPVGLVLVDGGREVVVADSNARGAPGQRPALTFVNVAAALAHRPAIVGMIGAGGYPREMTLEPDGRTLLIGDFASNALEAVEVP